MTQIRAKCRSQEEWLQLIQECRSSGLTDRTWCEQHGIMVSSFYNAVKRLRKKLVISLTFPLRKHMHWILPPLINRKLSRLIYVRIQIRKQFCLQNRWILKRTLTIHIRLNLWWMTFPLRSAIRQIRSFCSRSSECYVRYSASGYFRCRCHLYRYRLYRYEKIYWWIMRPHSGTVPTGRELKCSLSVLRQKMWPHQSTFERAWWYGSDLQEADSAGPVPMAERPIRGQESHLEEFDWLMSGIDIDQPKAIKVTSDQTWIVHMKSAIFPLFSAFFSSRLSVNQPHFLV